MNNTELMTDKLISQIDQLSNEHREFLVSPDKDFTRFRKLSYSETVRYVLCMEGDSCNDEIYNYFGLDELNPTSSAIIQQRSKIRPEAFRWLFQAFNRVSYDSENYKYKGYRLLAVDGSVLAYPTNCKDTETYVIDGYNRYSAFHLNASYDLMEHTYDDAIIQYQPTYNETAAFNEMVDRYEGDKAIFIADRGYCSINSFEHVRQSGNYCILRSKDIHSSTSMAVSFIDPDKNYEEFDMSVRRTLTRRYTNEIRTHREIYKFMPKNQKFDYFGDDRFYDFECRIVRFRMDSKDGEEYETIFTNLPADEFPMEEIKKLYNMRWGIETSFRKLKYSVGLNAFHSRKKEFIIQEIYARLIFYNFSERVVGRIKPRKGKYVYRVDFTHACHRLREYLRIKKGDAELPDIEAIIAKKMTEVKPNRNFHRINRKKSAIFFSYRF